MPDACARVGDPGRFLFAVPLPLSASAPVFSESHAAEEALERRHHVGSISLRPRSV